MQSGKVIKHQHEDYGILSYKARNRSDLLTRDEGLFHLFQYQVHAYWFSLQLGHHITGDILHSLHHLYRTLVCAANLSLLQEQDANKH